MQIPHVFFGLINVIMRMLLRSPLHGIFSGSILAIGYEGVRSGRQFWVPARYQVQGGEYLVVTSKDTKWWPNFKHGCDVRVLLGGSERIARASITIDQPDIIGQTLRSLWERHPGDAAYMNVKLERGVPLEEDFQRAVAEGVLVRLVLRDS